MKVIFCQRYQIFFQKRFRMKVTGLDAQYREPLKKKMFEAKHLPSPTLTPTHALSLFVFHRQPSDPHNIVTAQLHCQ